MRDLPGQGMPTLYGSYFAEVYSKYGYNQFSARVAELLPRVLRTLHLTPDRVLDVPCGEGTFALEMARKGYQTTGVDRSSAMLGVARRKAREAHAKIRLVERDMRALRFYGGFDLVISWYECLNYLRWLDVLSSTFAAV